MATEVGIPSKGAASPPAPVWVEAAWMRPGYSQKVAFVAEGAFGKVYRGFDEEGLPVAIKRYKYTHLDCDRRGIDKEIQTLRLLSGVPGVVKVVDVWEGPCSSRFAALRWAGDDLGVWVKRTGPFPAAVIREVLRQALITLAGVHDAGYMHRDLKPHNVFMSADGDVTIGDFGSSTVENNPTMTPEACTLWFRSPESLLHGRYSFPSDIWALGVTAYHLATGSHLFKEDTSIESITEIFQALGTPTKVNWPEGKTLPNFQATFPQWAPKHPRAVFRGVEEPLLGFLTRLCALDPKKRPTARFALSDPYFAAGEAFLPHVPGGPVLEEVGCEAAEKCSSMSDCA